MRFPGRLGGALRAQDTAMLDRLQRNFGELLQAGSGRAAPLRLRFGGELTIASGEITVTAPAHTVDTEGNAATDDLDRIIGGMLGDLLTLFLANSARDVTLRHNTGTSPKIRLAGAVNFTLGDTLDNITLMRGIDDWIEWGGRNDVS